MSQASGLHLETPVQPGECVWPWGENRGKWAVCSGDQEEKFSGLGERGKARSEGAGEEETFLIGQRLAQLHFHQRMWSLPAPCHFLQELPSTHYFTFSS